MCDDIRTITFISLFVPALRSEGYRKVPYHYYEAGSRDECAEYILHESAPYGGHRFITEKSVFAKWGKKHPIKFVHPEWQLSWPRRTAACLEHRNLIGPNTPCLNALTNKRPRTGRDNLNWPRLHQDYSGSLRGCHRKGEWLARKFGTLHVFMDKRTIP